MRQNKKIVVLNVHRSTQFKKDLKRILKQNKDIRKLEMAIGYLQKQKPLQLIIKTNHP